MEEPKKKKHTGLWVGGTIIAALAIVGIASASPASTVPTTSQSAEAVQTVAPATPTQSPSTVSATILSNNNYYTNVDGNSVHSPAYSSNGVPEGATAECRDGTYSFSQHHSGTCSHHGGVVTWLN